MLNTFRKVFGKGLFGVDDVEETLVSLRDSAIRNHQWFLSEQRASEQLDRILVPISRCVHCEEGTFTPSSTVFNMILSYVSYSQRNSISLLIGEQSTEDDFSRCIKNQTGHSQELNWQDAIEKLFDDTGRRPLFVFVWIWFLPKSGERFKQFEEGFRNLSEKRKIVLVLGGPEARREFPEVVGNLKLIP